MEYAESELFWNDETKCLAALSYTDFEADSDIGDITKEYVVVESVRSEPLDCTINHSFDESEMREYLKSRGYRRLQDIIVLCDNLVSVDVDLVIFLAKRLGHESVSYIEVADCDFSQEFIERILISLARIDWIVYAGSDSLNARLLEAILWNVVHDTEIACAFGSENMRRTTMTFADVLASGKIVWGLDTITE